MYDSYASSIRVEEEEDLATPLLSHYKKLSALDNKNVFRLTKKDLTLFFDRSNIKLPDNQGESRISLNILRDCDYNNGLCKLLNTDPEIGIIGDQDDLKRRQKIFGNHFIALPKTQSFNTVLARQFEDEYVQTLIIAATVFLIFGVFRPPSEQIQAQIEVLSIFTGVLFATLISAVSDYIKESQYLKLKGEINNQKITVYRGAYGTCTSIPVRDLVVGDIVEINQGDRVPADCILIQEMNITIDQTIYNPKEEYKCVYKSVSERPQTDSSGQYIEDNHKHNPDPFLFADSKVMSG